MGRRDLTAMEGACTGARGLTAREGACTRGRGLTAREGARVQTNCSGGLINKYRISYTKLTPFLKVGSQYHIRKGSN